MTRPLAPCGTRAAAARHRRRDEQCSTCRQGQKSAFHKANAANAEQTLWDSVLEMQPPVITWAFDPKRRVWVAAEINDPHAETPHSPARRESQLQHYAQRKAAS